MAAPRILPRDYLKARRLKLKAHGIVYPATTVAEARRAGLKIDLACAILLQETSGGHNVFGHDAVRNPVQGGYVTYARYRQYLTYRQRGQGSQGVGPCQLTYFAFQDRADRLGGCWQPWLNMRVGFTDLAANIRRTNEWAGIKLYNGSGAKASHYADEVTKRAEILRHFGVHD